MRALYSNCKFTFDPIWCSTSSKQKVGHWSFAYITTLLYARWQRIKGSLVQNVPVVPYGFSLNWVWPSVLIHCFAACVSAIGLSLCFIICAQCEPSSLSNLAAHLAINTFCWCSMFIIFNPPSWMGRQSTLLSLFFVGPFVVEFFFHKRILYYRINVGQYLLWKSLCLSSVYHVPYLFPIFWLPAKCPRTFICKDVDRKNLQRVGQCPRLVLHLPHFSLSRLFHLQIVLFCLFVRDWFLQCAPLFYAFYFWTLSYLYCQYFHCYNKQQRT